MTEEPDVEDAKTCSRDDSVELPHLCKVNSSQNTKPIVNGNFSATSGQQRDVSSDRKHTVRTVWQDCAHTK